MSEFPVPPSDELTERLAALGRQPVDPALQSQHLTAMASVRAGRSFRTSLAGRLKLAAGVFGGFLLGASGLASVGGLGPLQPIVAERAAEVANVDLPQGPKDKAEKAEKAAKEKAEKARLDDGSIGTARDWTDDCATVEGAATYAGNRGQYLKQERAKGPAELEAAKASTCGMPLGGDDEDKAPEVDDDTKTESDDKAQNDGAGKSDDDHGKSGDAPGKSDDPASAGKAKGGDASDDADENKPETPTAPPSDAGKSGVTPPVENPPATPAAAEDAGDDEV